jgi:hypothetical protein
MGVWILRPPSRSSQYQTDGGYIRGPLMAQRHFMKRNLFLTTLLDNECYRVGFARQETAMINITTYMVFRLKVTIPFSVIDCTVPFSL